MAWTEKLPSGKYRGCYRDASGRKRHTPAVTHKPAALRAAAIEEEKVLRGQRRDPAGPRMKWGAWCDQWEPARAVEPSTRRGNAPYLKRCRARWEDVPLGMISRHDLQAWVRQLERDLSASGVRQAFYLLSASLNEAKAHGLIDVNPCEDVPLPMNPPAVERYLDDEEVGAIFFHLDERWLLLAELLLDSGMRLAEACGLHRERVNLDAGTLTVVETWDVHTRSMKAYPKGRRIRTLPLTSRMVEQLAAWFERHPDAGTCGRPHRADESRRARARAAGRAEPTSCRSSLVIAGPRGAPIDPHNYATRQWAPAVRLAGVPNATPHALRHTYASRLLTADVPIARVSRLLGHASIATTERYAHLADDRFDDVRAALDGRGAAGGAEPGSGVSQEVSRRRRLKAL